MKYFIGFLLCLYAWVGQAQYNISGVITDKNGFTIPKTELFLSNGSLNQACSSNASGYFQFTDLASGTYNIEIVKDNYIEIKQVIIKGENITFDIQINLENQLDEVHLKIESVKSQIEKKGFAVNVIETKEASLRNIQTNELLNQTVGVKVRQNGGLGASVNYNLNGMSGNSIKIFIDGIPMSSYGSSFSLNSISPNMIERIEVYKGVVPGYLSDDALGGAINIILKKNVNSHLNASLSYGSFNTTQASFNGAYKAKNSGFFFRSSGFYNHSDNDYEVWGKFVRNILPNGRYDYVKAKRFNDAYKSYGGVVELGYQDVKWADNFAVGFTRSSMHKEIQHGTYMSIPYKGRFVEGDANIFHLTYKKTNILPGLDVNFHGLKSTRNTAINDTVKYNYNWYGEISRDLNGNPILRPDGAQQGAPTLLNIDRDILSFRGGFDYNINDQHKLIANHMFYDVAREEDDEILSDTQRNYLGTRDVQKNISSFTYEARLLDEKLKASAFTKYYQQHVKKMEPEVENQNGEMVRVEKTFSSNKTAIGYGAAFSYLVQPAFAILISAEKAVRMPTENEVFGDAGQNIVENLTISAEQSNNLNVGFKAGMYKIKNHRVSFSANAFLRDTRDKIVRKTQSNLNDAIQTIPFENLGKTKSIGIDTEINYKYKNKLNVLLNFSKFDTRFNNKYDNNGNVLSIYNVQIPNDPFLTASAHVKYTVNNFLQKEALLHLYYNFNYVDSFYNIWVPQKVKGIDQFEVPEQFIQDIGISYTFPKKDFVVSFDVKNILDKQAYDNFAVQKPGRAFYIKLNYSILNL